MESHCDLCVPESPQSLAVLEELFAHNCHLVAIERTIDLDASAGSSTSKVAKKDLREATLKQLTPPNLSAFASSALARFSAAHGTRAKILSRLTVRFSKASDAATLCQQFSNEMASNFDLVAACPLQEEAFNFACDQMAVADLVQLDCRERPAFRLGHAMVRRARSRGINFELLLSPMLVSSTCRSYTVSVAQNLFQVTGGKNFIFSSGARSVWDVRNQVGMVSVAAMLGAPNHLALQCVRDAPRATLLRGLMRTRTAFGAVAIRKLERQRGVKAVTVVKATEEAVMKVTSAKGDEVIQEPAKPDDIKATKKRVIDLDGCHPNSPKKKKKKKNRTFEGVQDSL